MKGYVLRDALSGRYAALRDCDADVELVEDIAYALTYDSRREAERAHGAIVKMLPRSVFGVEEVREP